jgi:hypothetical protein
LRCRAAFRAAVRRLRAEEAGRFRLGMFYHSASHGAGGRASRRLSINLPTQLGLMRPTNDRQRNCRDPSGTQGCLNKNDDWTPQSWIRNAHGTHKHTCRAARLQPTTPRPHQTPRRGFAKAPAAGHYERITVAPHHIMLHEKLHGRELCGSLNPSPPLCAARGSHSQEPAAAAGSNH